MLKKCYRCDLRGQVQVDNKEDIKSMYYCPCILRATQRNNNVIITSKLRRGVFLT